MFSRTFKPNQVGKLAKNSGRVMPKLPSHVKVLGESTNRVAGAQRQWSQSPFSNGAQANSADMPNFTAVRHFSTTPPSSAKKKKAKQKKRTQQLQFETLNKKICDLADQISNTPSNIAIEYLADELHALRLEVEALTKTAPENTSSAEDAKSEQKYWKLFNEFFEDTNFNEQEADPKKRAKHHVKEQFKKLLWLAAVLIVWEIVHEFLFSKEDMKKLQHSSYGALGYLPSDKIQGFLDTYSGIVKKHKMLCGNPGNVGILGLLSGRVKTLAYLDTKIADLSSEIARLDQEKASFFGSANSEKIKDLEAQKESLKRQWYKERAQANASLNDYIHLEHEIEALINKLVDEVRCLNDKQLAQLETVLPNFRDHVQGILDSISQNNPVQKYLDSALKSGPARRHIDWAASIREEGEQQLSLQMK